jgi:4-diphosphocytidyl-2-C-methyl-D-erythritol kinase
VHKYLPMGGGLGGGSSDAATVLLALNYLWGSGLSNDELAQLGLQLGADVPVFVHGQATWAEGVGEKFTPIELPEPWYLVLVPAVSISTAEVFSHPDLTRDSSQITIRAFLDGERSNDCLNVVKKTSPEVSQAIDWLDNFSEARLTGTGACIFAEFDSEDAAREVWQKLPKNLTGFVTKGCNVSPLMERLANS